MSLPADLGRERTDELTPAPAAAPEPPRGSVSGPRELAHRLSSRGKTRGPAVDRPWRRSGDPAQHRGHRPSPHPHRPAREPAQGSADAFGWTRRPSGSRATPRRSTSSCSRARCSPSSSSSRTWAWRSRPRRVSKAPACGWPSCASGSTASTAGCAPSPPTRRGRLRPRVQRPRPRPPRLPAVPHRPRPRSTTSASSAGSAATRPRCSPVSRSATARCWPTTRRWSTSAAAGPSWSRC